MSYQRRNPGDDDYIDVEYTEVTPAPRSSGVHLLPRRSAAIMSEVMEQAIVLSTHDRCLALLAKSGLEHAAALSMMEQQFTSMAPQGAERYREIVDAYAQKAADKIRRW